MGKHSHKKPVTKKWWFWVVIALLAWGIIGAALGYGDTAQDAKEPAQPQSAVQDRAEVEAQESIEDQTATTDDGEPEIPNGELLSINVNDDNVAVVKAKIASSWNNKMTIDQNYYNVVTLIREYRFDQYDEIQYWAVADMSDGSEQKVVSFKVPKSTIDMVASADQFADNTLGDYIDDLWVHQSLR